MPDVLTGIYAIENLRHRYVYVGATRLGFLHRWNQHRKVQVGPYAAFGRRHVMGFVRRARLRLQAWRLGPFCVHKPWSVINQYADTAEVDLKGTRLADLRAEAIDQFGVDYQAHTHVELTPHGTCVRLNNTDESRRCELWSALLSVFPVSRWLARRIRRP